MTYQTRGPFKVTSDTVEGPTHLMPWLKLIEGHMPRVGYYNAMLTAAEVLCSLMASGWEPPNSESEDDDTDTSEAAIEVADLVLRSLDCPDEQRAGVNALLLDAVNRYRKICE